MLDQINFREPVKAALLFGSQSRGDAVAGSDTDVAVFANAASAAQLIEIKRDLVLQCLRESTINFSVYSTKTAKAMALQGRLYLWHLKLEGQPLFDHRFLEELFYNLHPYSKAKAAEDIETFATVLSDMQIALLRGSDTVYFEAATAFSIMRSLGMMMGALTGHFIFSRIGPVRYLAETLGNQFLFTDADACRLLSARLAYAGKSRSDINISVVEMRETAEKLATVLQAVKERLK